MERQLRRRHSLRSQLDGLLCEAEDHLRGNREFTAAAVSVLLERIGGFYGQIEKVDEAIFDETPDDLLDSETLDAGKYRDKVVSLTASLRFKLQECRSSSSPRPANVHPLPTGKCKLPQLELLKFDGNRRLWQRFWTQFTSAVHNNDELSTADKFNYLSSLVTGAAASAISGLQATEECYKDAIEILKKRFGDDQIIVQDHLQGLLDLKPVSSSSDVRQLRQLYDKVQVHIRSLKALGTSSTTYCTMLREILLRVLPTDMVLRFHEERKTPIPSADASSNPHGDSTRQTAQPDQELHKLLEFFDHQLMCREAVAEQTVQKVQRTPEKEGRKTPHKRDVSTTSALQSSASRPHQCFFCRSGKHLAEVCDTKELSLSRKKELLAKAGRCFRCLKQGHLARDCRSRLKCDKCARRHATSVCTSDSTKNDTENVTSTPVNLVSKQAGSVVLLQTLTATIAGATTSGRYRILFDGGSQRSFITTGASQRLGCELLEEETLTVGVFGGQHTRKTMKKVRVIIHAANKKRPISIEALEVDTICSEHIPVPEEQVIRAMNKIHLDTQALSVQGVQDNQIAVLIGSDYYWELVTGTVKPVHGKLKAVETRLGWTVQGPLPVAADVIQCANVVVLRASVEDQEISKLLTRFWDLESIGIKAEDERATDGDLVLASFEDNITKTNERYEVALPWKERVDLSDNYAVATKRLHSLMKKLNKEPELLERYDATIRLYLDEGSAEKVSPTGEDPCGRLYYMPHRAVIREDRATTKVRIVFDASSHESGAKSLNDNLEAGPSLNPDVVMLLLRFRRYKVAMNADVEKAFLQIGLREPDRDALRFLWFKTSPQADRPLPELEVWRMTRVPFGATSSPFLLTATLKHHFRSVENRYPVTARLLQHSMYMDDLLIGADTTEEAIQMHKEIIEIFQEASMNIRKWASNDPVVAAAFEERMTSQEKSLCSPSGTLKVLGLYWNKDSDTFSFKPQCILHFIEEHRFTKRFVLQAVARVYDPLGFLSPFLVRAKIFLQDLWRANLDWDDPLPSKLSTIWLKWSKEVAMLQDLSIPRFLAAGVEGPYRKSDLHIFSDASEAAYGAAAYLRTVDASGNACTILLLAKTRVAPLKTVTLARLELMSALLAARMYAYIIKNCDLGIAETTFWSDSQITLCWINKDPTTWKTFVRNRTQEIRSLTDYTRWRFCPGKENPADLLTRGLSAQKLTRSQLWWHGPEWLARSAALWPGLDRKLDLEDGKLDDTETGPEINTHAVNTRPSVPSLIDSERFSSLTKLLRVTAWVIRYTQKLRKDCDRSGELSAEEVQQAERYLLRVEQRTHFGIEADCVANKNTFPSQSPVGQLRLFLDNDGLLRVQGRAENADDSYSSRHPILLPKDSHIGKLIIRHAHEKVFHGGVRDTLTQVRERFWILQARQSVKKALRRCVVCQRLQSKPVEQISPSLPEDRFKQASPFLVSGVDFAGPLYMKGHRQGRSYIALFTCAVTRAVHLELVSDLTTESFLCALRRFVSRRGLCHTVYSDNARTFVKASKELQKLWRTIRHPDVLAFFSSTKIQWKFICPSAPWWGGFYERLVRSVKNCLKKMLGRRLVSQTELATLLTEVEAIVNSRPLTYVFNDVDEPCPLSPASFLVGKRLTALPPYDATINIESSNDQLKNLWRRREEDLEAFWSRWFKEYTNELRNFPSNQAKRTDLLKKGNVVLLGEKQRPRQVWSLARIEELICGRDGIVRSCSLRLPCGTVVKRPVQLLYPLEAT